MGKNEAPDRSSESSDVPEVLVVEVTVLRDPDARASRMRLVRWPAMVGLGLLVAILAMAGTLQGGPDGAGHGVGAVARETGPAGVAAADGYPLRCLSITILAADQAYARADFNHRRPCGRFTGYSTAIFHRVMGAWRPVLDAVGYVCPVASLPVNVQTELGVCLQPTSQLRAPN
jgi:hypothetical protein